MLKTNYHTHSFRCKHGLADEEAYIIEAIKLGYEVIGFSDHCPYKDFTSLNIRMDYEQLELYINNVNRLKIKYQNDIKILLGLECEYFENQITYYEELKMKVDYLIFGNHFHTVESDETNLINIHTKEQYAKHLEIAIKGMESGLFSYLAHPDVFCKYSTLNDDAKYVIEEICKKAKELDFLLEINVGGLKLGTFTTTYMLKMMQKYDNRVIIGIDAHSPKAFYDKEIEEAIQLVSQYKLRIQRYL